MRFPAIILVTFLFPEFDEIPLVGEDICALAYQQAAASNISDIHVNSNLSTGHVTAESPIQYLQRWEDRHVHLLISSYSKFKNLLGQGKPPKKKFLQKFVWNLTPSQSKKCLQDNACKSGPS